jgi:hypothetical protein
MRCARQKRRHVLRRLPDIIFEGFCGRPSPDQFEEIPETLRPRNWRGLRRCYETLRIDVLGQLRENGSNLVQVAGVPLVADEVDRRRLDRRNANRAARRVEALHRNVGSPFSRHEGNTDGAAGDRPPVFCDDDLELLRAMMRGAVVLREARIIDQPMAFHERGNELIRRKAAQLPVLGRDDDAESARRTRH